jgi:hypothetical protein
MMAAPIAIGAVDALVSNTNIARCAVPIAIGTAPAFLRCADMLRCADNFDVLMCILGLMQIYAAYFFRST